LARRLLLITAMRCRDTQLTETAIKIATLLAAVLVHVERRVCVRGPSPGVASSILAARHGGAEISTRPVQVGPVECRPVQART
jgi:hypothetical protein